MTLQLELAIKIELMPDVRVLPMLEIVTVDQAFLMEATDLIGIQMGLLHLFREVGRMLELVELPFKVVMIFGVHQ